MNESHKKAKIYSPPIFPLPILASAPSSLFIELSRVSRVILLASNSESGSPDFFAGSGEREILEYFNYLRLFIRMYNVFLSLQIFLSTFSLLFQFHFSTTFAFD